MNKKEMINILSSFKSRAESALDKGDRAFIFSEARSMRKEINELIKRLKDVELKDVESEEYFEYIYSPSLREVVAKTTGVLNDEKALSFLDDVTDISL